MLVRSSGRGAALVFCLALGARLLYLAECHSLVWFGLPLVDGANYVRTARLIAAGNLLGGREAFWQPPLYPYFLALWLSILGERIVWILMLQAALGALSAVLVFRIGRRLFGDRAGIAAGCVTALYG